MATTPPTSENVRRAVTPDAAKDGERSVKVASDEAATAALDKFVAGHKELIRELAKR